MDSKYLPSKSFVKKTSILLVLIIVVVLMVKFIPSLKKKMSDTLNSNIFVKDAIENDSNKNGILDWEEKIWGLDPKGDGPSNKEFINAKKRTLAENNENNTPLTESDKLSREFFSLIMALEESGLSTEDALAKISSQIGEKIEVVPLVNKYTYSDLITNTPSKSAISKYQLELTKIIGKYNERGVGTEMNLLALALDHSDKSLLGGLTAIQSSYFDMIKELLEVHVPNEIATTHLVFLNNLYGSATSLPLVSKVFSDSISGLSGIATYKKNSDNAAKALLNITIYIGDGIIN